MIEREGFWDKMFDRGFVHDKNCNIYVTPTSELEFTTHSERNHIFAQENKDVSRLAEITHTINKYEAQYLINQTPEIKIETRHGQFEYMFLYCDILKYDNTQNVLPTTSPIISQLKFTVQGNENLYTSSLDRYDLERISRENCDRLCDWRTLHNSGRGILLKLDDIGLTKEQPFPQRSRIQLRIQLISTIDPDTEHFPGGYETANVLMDGSDVPRRFTVALIRSNQLFRADIRDGRFLFLNEQ